MNKINMIIQTYPEKNENRLDEITFCILNNLHNNAVEKIYNLYEGDDDTNLPVIIRTHPKYVAIKFVKRLSYLDIFNFSNNNLRNKLCCTSNCDIMLDTNYDLDLLNTSIDEKTIFAISRHDYDPSGSIYTDQNFNKILHAHTQDAWFYRSPVNIKDDIDYDFALGMLGCDNAIADRLVKSGYLIYNMMMKFKIIHVDNIRNKKSDNFLEFHKNDEIMKKIINAKPEEKGCFLVPNFDLAKMISIDELLLQFKCSNEDKQMLLNTFLNDNHFHSQTSISLDTFRTDKCIDKLLIKLKCNERQKVFFVSQIFSKFIKIEN